MRRIVLLTLALVVVLSLTFVTVNATVKAECVPVGNHASLNPCAPGDPNSAASTNRFTTDGRVIANALFVRSGPGVKYPAPVVLRRGDKVRFLTRTDNGFGDWVGVAAYDRKTGQVVFGWVWDPLVTGPSEFATLTTAAGAITVRDLTVRPQRSTVVNDDNQTQAGSYLITLVDRFQTR